MKISQFNDLLMLGVSIAGVTERLGLAMLILPLWIDNCFAVISIKEPH